MKQTKIQKSARNEECTLRIAGVCNYDVETTILAHISFGYGTDKRNRPNERNAVYACSACHDLIDKRAGIEKVSAEFWAFELEWYIGRALVRTTERRDELGV